MLRSLSPLLAFAFLAEPSGLAAQRPREPVDLATLVAASRTCREAPSNYGQATRHVSAQHWQTSDGGLPPSLRAMLPIPTFERDHVLLILVPPAMGGPGECKIVSAVRGAPAWPDVIAALTT